MDEYDHLLLELTWAESNEHGVWCPCCGELLAAPWHIDEDWEEPDSCKVCGFPDDGEQMSEYFN